MDPMIKQRPRRKMVWGLTLAAACALTVVSESKDAHRQQGKVSARARLEAGNGGDKVNVIVRFRQQPGATERQLIQSLGGHVRKEFRSARSSRWLSLRLPAR